MQENEMYKDRHEDKDNDGIPDFIDVTFDPPFYRYMAVASDAIDRLNGIEYRAKPCKGNPNTVIIKYNDYDYEAVKSALESSQPKAITL
ncbi:hypothetical protein FACS1894133_2380 [Clostridia bacterium]|nr:hypothetical protein FACS1894133_2380 [Clostridia bacterium]